MKKFKLFDSNAPGRGITKQQAQMVDNYSFSGFFRVYKDRFWNISTLNIFFILANFPIVFMIAALSGNFDLETTAPVSPLFAQLYGISQYGTTPFVSALSSVIGANEPMFTPSTITNVLMYLTLLIVLTAGISNTGASYILRGYVRGEPIYIFGDFIDAVKKNLRQAIILGILDCLFLFIFAYGILTYVTYSMGIMIVAELFIMLVYLTMRFYMYILMITFDLSIFKILKNSFIFAMVGYKRNICAWIAIALITLLSLYIFFALPFLGIALPFIITIGTIMMISAFAAYPVIKKYMIDPYYNKDVNKKNTGNNESPVFMDRG